MYYTVYTKSDYEIINFDRDTPCTVRLVLLRGIQFTHVQLTDIHHIQPLFLIHYCCNITRIAPNTHWPHIHMYCGENAIGRLEHQ
jgi:hypothetical protein